MRRLFIFSLLLISWGLFENSNATAGFLGCGELLRGVAGKLKRTYKEIAIRDLSFTDLEVTHSSDGKIQNLHLGAQVGSGCRGSVYRIDPGSDGAPRVAKIEMSFRLPVLSRHKAMIPESTERESVVTKILQDFVPEIEKSKFYPKDPAWVTGTFPVVPILDVYESSAGAVLIKPEVVAPKGIKNLKVDSQGHFEPSVERALHDIYDLYRAVHDRVPAVGIEAKQGMRLDIGTSNLFWVENPEDLKRFRMKKPGFCLFEVDQSAAFESDGKTLNQNYDFYPTWESFKTAATKDARAL
jgi:hypothetical protein